MNVAVVYFGNDKNIVALSDDIARYAHTHAIYYEDFDFYTHVNLLLIGVDARNKRKKYRNEINGFINQLNRYYIDNVTLFSVYMFNNRLLETVIKSCQEKDLPLMRDYYACQLPRKISPTLTDSNFQGARDFVSDMIMIVDNYY